MLSERDATLKTSFRLLVQACGGVHAAAEACRARKSAIEQYYSTRAECHTVFPPVDVVAALERACGRPLVTEALARLADDEAAPAGGGEDLHGRCAAVVTPVVTAVAKALEAAAEADVDGRLSLTEIETLLKWLDHGRCQIDRMTARLTDEAARRKAVSEG